MLSYSNGLPNSPLTQQTTLLPSVGTIKTNDKSDRRNRPSFLCCRQQALLFAGFQGANNVNTMTQVFLVLGGLVVCHFVIDWMFQSEEQAKAKAYSIKASLLHVFFYTSAFAPIAAILLYYVLNWPAELILAFILVNCGTHLLIDCGIYVWNKLAWETDKKKKYLFPVVVLDEVFHLGILFVTFISLDPNLLSVIGT